MTKEELLVLARYLHDYHGRPLRLMEVCGTHTAALHTTGIKSIISREIQLISGPGCPVCVTPSSYIDKLVEYAFRDNCRVLTFGDMLRVPGSKMSLATAKANGGKVDFFYNPEEVLTLAEQEPEILFVLGAVGFETTIPVWGNLVKTAKQEKITNIKLLTALKTMPSAMAMLCEKGNIDGFLCPGHVAVITGCGDFRDLSTHYQKPMVVGGFDREHLLRAVGRLVLAAGKNQGGFLNEYDEVVREEGNPVAQKLVQDVFVPGDAVWRGFGRIANSGMYLCPEYAEYDAGSRGLDVDNLPVGCCCDKVLLGEMEPGQCPCFGRACQPEHPVGACMVSVEGSCAISFANKI